MPLKTYDPLAVLITFGPVVIDGIDTDSFVTAERSGDAFTIKVGAGGEVVRTRNRDISGTVTVRLLAGSSTNDRLSAIAALDEQFGNYHYPIRVTDVSGTTLIKAGRAWIQKLPQVEKGKEAGNTEWMFQCAELEMFVGGTRET